MSRSPLASFLSRAYQALRAARAQGVPAEELLARADERRLVRRRELLELTAGAALVAGLPLAGIACSDGGSAGGGGDAGSDARSDAGAGDAGPTAPRIVVVGAGIAGLHCAYRLNKVGVAADVYDAAKAVGGRMLTDRTTFPDGMHAEVGGELVDTGHTTMLELATELGIELYDYHNDDAGLATLVAHIAGAPVPMAKILADFAPIAAKIDEAVATLTDPEAEMTYTSPNNAQAIDGMSIAAWLTSAGATGMIRKLLEVAYTIEYGLDPDVSNAWNLLWLISTETTKLDIFGESDERFHTKAGNDTFIQKLAAPLPAGRIHLEHRLTAVAKASDGTYVVTFDKGGTPLEVKADHLVLALPFTMLRAVDLKLDLPAPKKKAIAELGYGKNTKLVCGFSSRPWRTGAAKSNGEVFTDLPFQSTWETSRLQPGASGIITNFSGGAYALTVGEGTPEAKMAAFLSDFDKVFPGAKAASNGKVMRAAWSTHPLVKGSYAAYLVGQYTTIRGAEGERFENVHFCGEHTSIEAQGFMEGGAATGKAVAAEILRAIGKTALAPRRVHRRGLLGPLLPERAYG